MDNAELNKPSGRYDRNDPYDFDSLRAMANYHASDPAIREAIDEYSDGDGVIRTSDENDVEAELEGDPTVWQSECLETIRSEKHVILSSPTGSGKTRVFLEWAKEKKEQEEAKGKKHTIYITAPIKALSNQRFRELKKQGIKVGLETGDIKDIPEDAEYICCTQEIYANKYINDENSTLIIDEFHYVFEDNYRARKYVDSLHKSKAQNMLLASATFGDTDTFRNYIDRVSGKNFYNYENKKRITSLEYKGEIDKKDINNSLVVTFSAENCRNIAKLLQEQKEVSDQATRQSIDSIAAAMKVDNEDLIASCKCGVAFYYGAMLPKEKLFVEQLYENRLIDTVVGTDALALGVNFPVQKVVYAQLAKYNGRGPISKNLFEQLSGRAGRYGYFNKGEVYYCNFGVEDLNYSTPNLFKRLLESKNENATISLTPNIKSLLLGRVTAEEEADFICHYSTESYDMQTVQESITRTLNRITGYVPFPIYEGYDNEEEEDDEEYEDNALSVEEKEKKNAEFRDNIANVYFEEFTPEKNCRIFRLILRGYSTEQLLDRYSYSFSELLQLRKYFRQLPKKYRRKIDFKMVDQYINDIDDTALKSERPDIQQFISTNQDDKKG